MILLPGLPQELRKLFLIRRLVGREGRPRLGPLPQIMTKYIVEESGDFRSGEEGVFNGEECIFMAPPARFVPQLMNELFDWMNEVKD